MHRQPFAAQLGSFDHELGDYLHHMYELPPPMKYIVETTASYERNILGGYLSPPPPCYLEGVF